MSPLDKIAREICWLGFALPSAVGKTKASYWQELPDATKDEYRKEAKQFVWLYDNLDLRLLERQPSFGPDPEYELVRPGVKKGRQCGKCWMKFEYNRSYGFYCGDCECSMGF